VSSTKLIHKANVSFPSLLGDEYGLEPLEVLPGYEVSFNARRKLFKLFYEVVGVMGFKEAVVEFYQLLAKDLAEDKPAFSPTEP